MVLLLQLQLLFILLRLSYYCPLSTIRVIIIIVVVGVTVPSDCYVAISWGDMYDYLKSLEAQLKEEEVKDQEYVL